MIVCLTAKSRESRDVIVDVLNTNQTQLTNNVYRVVRMLNPFVWIVLVVMQKKWDVIILMVIVWTHAVK
jgi:hypothetical protein